LKLFYFVTIVEIILFVYNLFRVTDVVPDRRMALIQMSSVEQAVEALVVSSNSLLLLHVFLVYVSIFRVIY